MAEQAEQIAQLSLAPEQRNRLDGQLRLAQAAQRRELVTAELEEPERRPEVLQPVVAEVAEIEVTVEQRARRLRDDDLTAVAGRTDPGRAVDVHAHVTLVGQ